MSEPKPLSPDKSVVTISRQEMQEALIMYAAGKSGTKYPLKHNIELNGILTLMGGNEDEELFCTVTLEHLPNVTPIGRSKRWPNPPPTAPAPCEWSRDRCAASLQRPRFSGHRTWRRHTSTRETGRWSRLGLLSGKGNDEQG